jgi:hypothetical protein
MPVFLLNVSGSGGGGTPGGADGSVQYNNAGAFGGFGGWDGSTLTVPGAVAMSAGTVTAAPSVDTSIANKAYVDAAAAGGGAVTQGNFVVTGGGIEWLTGYDFNVEAASYVIQGQPYSSPETPVTLDAADPTNPRLDAIVGDNAGTVQVIKGTAAATPSEPSIDLGTQVKFGLISVPAASSQPDVTNTVLYYQNAGAPTEWNWAASGSGFNVNSTSNPKSPATHDIEGTSVSNGAYAEGTIGSGTHTPSGDDLLILYIRSKATWANNRGLAVSLRSGGAQVGQVVQINRSGSFGFTSSLTGVYQLVAIPISLFSVTGAQTITKIRIAAFGSGHGFYIGDVKFQAGGTSQGTTGITQEQADARYLQQTNNLSDLANTTTARDTLIPAGSLAATKLTTGAKLREMVFPLYNGGDVLATGKQGFNVSFPVDGTITGWRLLSADGSNVSLACDIWKCTYADYAPTTHPAVGDSITASAKPTITTAKKNESSTLTGWTTAVAAGDVFEINIDSVTGCTRATLTLLIAPNT